MHSLLLQARKLKVKEDHATKDILLCLLEIEEHKVFLEYGFGSMHTFCVEYLGYSDGAAFRRIQAMRLIKDIPKVKEDIQTGKVNITKAAQVQSLCRKEGFTAQKKTDIYNKVQGLTSRETEATLLQFSSEKSLPKERIKPLTEHAAEILFLADKDLQAKLCKAQKMHPHKSIAQIFELALDTLLNKRTRKTEQNPKSRRPTKQTTQQLLQKAGGRCQYISRHTGKRCSETRFLDVDHRKPWSKQGKTELENLQILCRMHNLHKGTIGE